MKMVIFMNQRCKYKICNFEVIDENIGKTTEEKGIGNTFLSKIPLLRK
jgi:hypothetical protein